MDKNFRVITDKIIEMQGVKNQFDKIGRVIKTTWCCREFDNLRDYNNYKYTETTYEYKGNVKG